MVVALLAFMAGLAVPLFRRSYAGWAEESALSGLIAAVDAARERAVLEGRPYGLEVDAGARSYGLSVRDDPGAPEDFRPLRESGARRTLPARMALRADPPRVVFYPDGTSGEARFELAAAGGPTRAFRLRPESGKAVFETSEER